MVTEDRTGFEEGTEAIVVAEAGLRATLIVRGVICLTDFMDRTGFITFIGFEGCFFIVFVFARDVRFIDFIVLWFTKSRLVTICTDGPARSKGLEMARKIPTRLIGRVRFDGNPLKIEL